jgi:hypothetical protein
VTTQYVSVAQNTANSASDRRRIWMAFMRIIVRTIVKFALGESAPAWRGNEKPGTARRFLATLQLHDIKMTEREC